MQNYNDNDNPDILPDTPEDTDFEDEELGDVNIETDISSEYKIPADWKATWLKIVEDYHNGKIEEAGDQFMAVFHKNYL